MSERDRPSREAFVLRAGRWLDVHVPRAGQRIEDALAAMLEEVWDEADERRRASASTDAGTSNVIGSLRYEVAKLRTIEESARALVTEVWGEATAGVWKVEGREGAQTTVSWEGVNALCAALESIGPALPGVLRPRSSNASTEPTNAERGRAFIGQPGPRQATPAARCPHCLQTMSKIKDMSDKFLISYDGESFYVRHVAFSVEDRIEGMLVFKCDEHLGGPFDKIEEAVRCLEQEMAKPRETSGGAITVGLVQGRTPNVQRIPRSTGRPPAESRLAWSSVSQVGQDPDKWARACALANGNEVEAQRAERANDPALWATLADEYEVEATAWAEAGHREFADKTRSLARKARARAAK